MADVIVNHSALEAASGDLLHGASQIAAALEAMDSELSLLRSSWEGQAQEAYLLAKTQWSEAMGSMQQVLSHIGQLVAQANNNYQSVDRAGAARFQ